jgi:exonuclease SbcD
MQDAIDEIHEKADGRSVICRFVLTGRSPLHASLQHENILNNFLLVLRDTEFSNSSFIWVDRIEDYTRLPVDRETLLRRKDFVGDVVNIVESLYENDNTFKDLRRTFEILLKSSIGKNLINNIDEEELPDLIQRAENILLDYLVTEEKHAD